jgi:hypothetical protein
MSDMSDSMRDDPMEEYAPFEPENTPMLDFDLELGDSPPGGIIAVGDAAGIEKYQEVRDSLTKLLYYGGKDVPVERAKQLVGLIEPFESSIIKHNVGLVKNAAGATISNDEYNSANQLRWWRTTGLPAMKPGDIMPAEKYHREIYAPALQVINAGAFLAHTQPTVIERIYMTLAPFAQPIADLPAGIASGTRQVVVEVVREVVRTVPEAGGAIVGGLGVTGIAMLGGAVLLAVLLLKK